MARCTKKGTKQTFFECKTKKNNAKSAGKKVVMREVGKRGTKKKEKKKKGKTAEKGKNAPKK